MIVPTADQRLIDRAFPFHFAVDVAGRITDAGPRLREIAAERLATIDFFATQMVEGPYRIRDHATLRREDGNINVVVLPLLDGVKLRGEFVADPGDESAPVRFLGHPWITSLDELRSRGLRLGDFPPHSGLSDMLVMLQSRESVNADLRRLAADLRDRSRRLEEELAARQELESQLQHAQRMEAMGRLAGGIAHDFNNVLTAIVGHASLGGGSKSLEDAQRHFATIAEAGRRASGITSRLLDFARRRPIEVEDVDLAAAVAEAGRLLAPLLGEQHRLEIELADDLPRIRTDATALQQAIVNLVINARDASAAGTRVRLTARSETGIEPLRGRFGERPAGRWVVIEVDDEGTGMPEAVLDHAFEPFFTTKDLGEGTGLGLATVWWVVERSGGMIDVASEIGRGTCFSIHLPASSVAAGDVDAACAGSATAIGDGRRLLVVEDDVATKSALVDLLAADGFEVEWAPSGEQASALIDHAASPFDVLLVDVVLPGMSGTALAEAIHLRQPWVRIVLMTAKSDAEVDDGVDGPVLRKPFTLDELRAAIGPRRA